MFFGNVNYLAQVNAQMVAVPLVLISVQPVFGLSVERTCKCPGVCNVSTGIYGAISPCLFGGLLPSGDSISLAGKWRRG